MVKKRKVKEIKKEPGIFQKIGKRNLFIIILFIALILVVGYMVFFYTKICVNFECFQESMEECSRADYINEEPEASWGYKIKGREGINCVVEVTLLNAKKGELGINEFVGHKMDCSYPAGISAYPEKDLDKCHGRLKEDLQEIIIEKLHLYVLENLKEFQESLFEAV